MSSNFAISGAIGTHVFAEDVLYTSSHPISNGIDTHWAKNPQYASISAVPLKTKVLDQFRRTARAVSGENESLADIEALETLFAEKLLKINKLDPVSLEIQDFIANNEFKECSPSVNS